MSAESIAEQIEIIVANVCPGATDPAGCESGIRENWEAIGNYILHISTIYTFGEPGTKI